MACASGCSTDQFVVTPSLDPRSSRVLPLRVDDFLEGRQCLVYLPPGYPEAGRRYPVLYVNDGENAFDVRSFLDESFGFDTIANKMIARGEIEPLIVVAIPSGGQRFRDYIPAIRYEPRFPDPPLFTVDRSRDGGAYLEAIVSELKPRIDASFATDPSSGATGIAGFSLGGLISVCALYDRPETFGIAGGFSGSYSGFSPHFLGYVALAGRPEDASLWIDTGLIADNVSAARRLDAIALEQGFVSGIDYTFLEIADGTHSVPSVRQRLPAFLDFFSRRAAAHDAAHGARRMSVR